MSYTNFDFIKTVELYFAPFKKHPIKMVIASVALGTVLFFYTNILLAEVIRQNTYDIHMLSAEQLIEVGPNYIYECDQYVKMIHIYTEHLEQRKYASLLRALYPGYDPNETLESELSYLQEAAKGTSEGKAQHAIQKAGLASENLFHLYKRFPRSPIKLF
jgi:hypothetical protein